MRPLILLPATLLLAACASPVPAPDPGKAWVELSAQPSDLFMADTLDGVRTDDGRYFEVTPGAHELEARYEFEVGGGSLYGDTQYLRCTLQVRYDAFAAGQRYRFEARSLGFRPQGWLYDRDRRVVARADAVRCR